MWTPKTTPEATGPTLPMAQETTRPERSPVQPSLLCCGTQPDSHFPIVAVGEKKSSIQTINAGFSLLLTFYPKMNHNLKLAVKCNLGFLAVRLLHFQRKPMAGRLDFVFANYTFLPRKLPAVQKKKWGRPCFEDESCSKLALEPAVFATPVLRQMH